MENWPYDAQPELPSLDEIPASPRPKVVTGLREVEVQERVVLFRDKPIVAFDELDRGGRVLVTKFDRDTFAALVHAFLTRAVCVGLTVESVSVEDVLWHLDMLLASAHGNPGSP